jgi:hypothetical protein
LRFKRKEREKLLSRRRLWSIFGWFWPNKKDNGQNDYTCNENDGGGMGYFKNNHSLNCGCGMCKDQTRYKRELKKKVRMKQKKEVRELMKVIKGQNNLD